MKQSPNHHKVVTKQSTSIHQMVTKWSPSSHQVLIKQSANSRKVVNNKWSQSDHTFSFTFIRFHPLSFIFIHFVHFHPLSSTCIHFHSLSSIFIHFILFTHFHPFPPPFYPLPSTFINFHSLSSTFIHIHPPSALQVVGKWSASGRQVVTVGQGMFRYRIIWNTQTYKWTGWMDGMVISNTTSAKSALRC